MILKTETPEIKEFMTGYLVNSYSLSSDKMDVYIPSIMIDKEASNASKTLIITNIFSNEKTVNTSKSVVSKNYISINVSDAFKHIYQSLYSPKNSIISKGEKIKIYCQGLDLDQAVAVIL